MKLKNFLLTAIMPAVAMTLSPTADAASINKGFFKKAAEKVWATDSEGIFNPATEIPDSVAEGQSGVIIARLDHFETEREEQNTIYSATGRTNRTKVRHTRRSMVKLLDQSAVGYYSDFEFGGTAVRRDYGIVIDATVENAFGARVHKRDGSTVDIDPSTALEVSDGKDGGKNSSFKIAIPSLEVGDVIEYFFYTEYLQETGDVCGLDAELSDRYPILTRMITGRLDPSLAAEFYSYNGAPKVTGTPDGEFIKAEMRCYNVPAVTFSRFLYPERQLPFVRLNVVNNYQSPEEQRFRSSTARGGGLFNSVSPASIFIEAKENIAYLAYLLWKSPRPVSPLPARALKMTKRFIKDHPGASPREIADAAYLALRYCNHTANDDDRIGSPFFLAMFLNDVIERLEIFPLESTGIGIINSRSEVPTEDLSGWDQSNFVACAGDTAYMMLPGFNIAPGEFPGEFQGESGESFLGRLRETTKLSPIKAFSVPDRRHSGNYVKTELTVSLAADDPTALDVTRSVRLGGSGKRYGAGLVDRAEWIRGVEGFLGIEKPYRIKGYDEPTRAAALRRILMDECEEVTGARPDSVMDYAISDRGFLPGHNEMEYSSSNRFSGLVENLGGDLSVTLGRLAGHMGKLEGSERDRLLDAMLPTAFQNTHVITFKVPEGYKVDGTSLADFNRNVVNALGLFMVNAKEDGEGDVTVQCVLRVKRATVPLQAWPLLCELYDAASRFADASLVLVKR